MPNLLPKNHFLQNVLLNILQTEMNDLENVECGSTWIEFLGNSILVKKIILKVYSNGEVPI